MRSQDKLLPQNWSKRQADAENHISLGQTPLWGPEQSVVSLNSELQGGPCFCEFHLQGLCQVLTGTIIKALHASGRRRGEGTTEIHQSILFSLTRLPSGEAFLPEPNLVGLYQNLTHLGEGMYPLAILSHLRGEPPESLVRFTFHRHQRTRRQRPDHQTKNTSSPPAPHQHVLKAVCPVHAPL